VNPTKPNTVGLFGYYGRHNFGDDLMAVLYARAIQDHDAECLVFGWDAELGDRYGVQTTRTLDEFVARSKLVVYGGGGALLPQPQSNPFSQLIGDLVDACQLKSVPLACLSIGGAGRPLRDVTPASRRRLVESATTVTVRDPNEALLLRDAGVRADFFDDVVWTTAAAFPHVRRSHADDNVVRIAVNLYPNDAFRRQLDASCNSVARRPGDVQWQFVESHTFSAEYRQAYFPASGSERFQSVQFQGVDHGLEFLSDCDMVVTSRLHIAVAAMSFGIPSVALAAEPKTKNCFAHLGLQANCWNDNGAERLARLAEPAERDAVAAAFEQLNRTAIQASAAGHLERLRQLLTGHAS
jgi:polysaccharide pyruvyl transferase WcaK-like protein